MAEAVARAIESRRHLVVQAGTGTGKSLAYLVPALTLGARVVVSTATKALQDQLAQRDLPRLGDSLGHKFDFAVLKGRSNYLCMQRVREISGSGEQLSLMGTDRTSGPLAREVRKLVEWAVEGQKKSRQLPKAPPFAGDRAELGFEPSDLAWSQVSTSSRECPGASVCPSGEDCLAEGARKRASQADVVVVNTHLYASSLALGEAELLPPHDVVVFDEAHELEDIASATFGFELSQPRLGAVARLCRAALPSPAMTSGFEDAATLLAASLKPSRDRALPRPLGAEMASAISVLREKAVGLMDELRRAGSSGPGSSGPGGSSGGGPGGAGAGAALGEQATRQRAQRALTGLVDDLNELLELPAGEVAWVEGAENAPVLRVAPIDVGGALAAHLWAQEDAPTAVLTSATIPPHMGDALGMKPGSYDELNVGSPFAYSEQALLYCPVHMPDPRSPSYEAAMHAELVALMQAAGGRTMALFTSWRAMSAAAEYVRERVPWTVLTQSDLPKPKLVEKFATDEHSCLFATMGFWQGVDVPGPALSLVTIDRLPFPRPDDPLLRARRDAMGPAAFERIDLPRAATLLAQGAGRLVRSRSDRGVVAVLDPRLGKARYRWELVKALPPMRRTRHRSEVEAFLAHLRA
ncbi:MAG TPA: ATP-dependent DNA helicase [Acidimicrobiales bacterium]|nr:ATP-dependent DNA helicase [Acidimicrobiales bacterium]